MPCKGRANHRGGHGCCSMAATTSGTGPSSGALLTTDDPIAAEVAPANIWECPNLVQVDGQWVLLVSLWRRASWRRPAGRRAIPAGRPGRPGQGWIFKATSGGVLDEGPAFYAPQVLAEPDRTLLWGWAWELGRSDQQIAEAGWAGVLDLSA